MRYAIVTDGIVTSVVLADDAADAPGGIPLTDGSSVGPHWDYDGTDFTAPAPVVALPQTITTPYEFLNRFTMDEQVGIELALAGDNPTVTLSVSNKATLKVFMRFVSTATVIHLDSDNATSGVAFLLGVGLIAAGRDVEILA